MKYAIYSLETKGLLRVVPDLQYDSQIEGYTPIADVILGNHTWEPTLLNYRDPEDPYYLIPSISFINKFTLSERLAIHTASATSAIVRDLLFMIIVSDKIDLCSDNVDKGLKYLSAVNIISPTRLLEIRGF